MVYIIDVNVPIAADGKTSHATQKCVLNCINFLKKLIGTHKFALDTRGKILSEYIKHLSSKRSPSLSAEFYKWIISNHANPQRCDKVNIRINTQRGFDEFPDDKRLKRFDYNDRKYIAVAIAHNDHPPIAQAVDRKWLSYERVLRSYGVSILFL